MNPYEISNKSNEYFVKDTKNYEQNDLKQFMKTYKRNSPLLSNISKISWCSSKNISTSFEPPELISSPSKSLIPNKSSTVSNLSSNSFINPSPILSKPPIKFTTSLKVLNSSFLNKERPVPSSKELANDKIFKKYFNSLIKEVKINHYQRNIQLLREIQKIFYNNISDIEDPIYSMVDIGSNDW